MFESIPIEALFSRLCDVGISETLLISIIGLYESMLGHLCNAHSLLDFIRSTIGVKQGYLLLLTLFGIYIVMSWNPFSRSTYKMVMVAFYVAS